MKSLISLIFLVTLPTVALAAPKPVERPLSAAAAQGRMVAQIRCASCHAIVADRVSPNPKAPTFPDLAGRFGEHSLQQKLAEIEETGHFYMPPQRVSSEDVTNLVAYFNTLPRP